MSNVALVLWEMIVAMGIFGWGIASLHLLGFKRPSLALSGVFGVSLFIALGGWLNLFHLLRPSIFFVLAGTGVLLAIYRFVQGRRNSVATGTQAPRQPWTLAAKLFFGAAVVMNGVMMLSGVRQLTWNYYDDLQGYLPLAVKALELHAIPTDPFCERRVVTGVGGSIFLEAAMYAEGNIRAIPFIDSTLGLFLYVLSLWAIGRRWKVSPAGLGFALFCLPFATLMKVNLTIVYLSVAAFLVTLLLLTDFAAEERVRPAWIAVLGIIVGAMCTTKSPNIVFIVPFLIVCAILRKLWEPRAKPLLPVALVLVSAIAVFMPYSIANKATAGTYLYPLLGLGDEVTAYGRIPPPSQVGSNWQVAFVVAPDLLLLALALLFVWKLTRQWAPGPRSAVVAYMVAALAAVPITAHGLGGEGVDRYTAPLAMPALLLALLVIFAVRDKALRAWRRLGIVVLSLAGIYVFTYLGCKLDWYTTSTMLAYDVVNRVAPRYLACFTTLSNGEIRQNLAYGARVQAAIPPGATAIEDVPSAYMFNFRRNTIYLQDYAGTASPPPGWPLSQNPEAARRFLIQHGVDYIIMDNHLRCEPPTGRVFSAGWQDFVHNPRRTFTWKQYLRYQGLTHGYAPWSNVEGQVTCRARQQIQAIMARSPLVYNDGTTVVARID